jgi:uncharacterized protein
MISNRMLRHGLVAPAILLSGVGLAGPQIPPMQSDIPKAFEAPTAQDDYVRRDTMIAMRDGVRLHTVIIVPKGVTNAPIILTRTPYSATRRTERNPSPHALAVLPPGDDVFMGEGYIRVIQDVRGKYGSQGDYVMNRPLRGPLNQSKVDHSTDTYDTIDWLVKHVPESNGKVGMIGNSYEGFTVLMGLVDPHPALKVAVPMCPMVDVWRGDDWFHSGAFRQANFDFFYWQTTVKGGGAEIKRGVYDDYDLFRRAGSAGDFAHQFGIDQLPFFSKLAEHPAYDDHWQAQAMDRILAARPLKVATMFVGGLWDQEDIYGAVHAYAATEPRDTANDRCYLVLGPWRHGGQNSDGSALGSVKLAGDTGLQFRRDIMKPFLDTYLKDGAARADTPPVLAYQTGTNTWQRLTHWPLACETGCETVSRPLYLQPGFGLGFTAPAAAEVGFDEYVSDPAKPVPHVPRPVRFADSDAWGRWLVTDQRSVADRTDVLTYTSGVLQEPLRISGEPVVHLMASTTGTDCDWVVKLIDFYPDEVPAQPEMGGYQLAIAMDILRGRYRKDLAHPSPIVPGEVERYHFALPNANHVFLPGHRLMVQIQSSWFPLYDRNPQTYVDNIFFAKPSDYRAATQRIYHAGDTASFISLPVVSPP